jgi:hypothetical protein
MSERINFNENQFYSFDSFIDPFWLKYRPNIDSVRNFLSAPKTQVGEKICRSALSNSLFREYSRLQLIFSGLISLVEIEEILKSNHKKFANNPTDQIIILKAYKVLIEDTLKYDYNYSLEKKGFNDYQLFFKWITTHLNLAEKNIKNKGPFPDFINTLFLLFQREVNRLTGVNNFRINTRKIRQEIAKYIPRLNNVDEINTKNSIQNQWEEAFSKKFNIRQKDQDKEI